MGLREQSETDRGVAEARVPSMLLSIWLATGDPKTLKIACLSSRRLTTLRFIGRLRESHARCAFPSTLLMNPSCAISSCRAWSAVETCRLRSRLRAPAPRSPRVSGATCKRSSAGVLDRHPNHARRAIVRAQAGARFMRGGRDSAGDRRFRYFGACSPS